MIHPELKEKIESWWWYNRKFVLLGAAALLIVLYIVIREKDITEPDYHIAMVVREKYSDETIRKYEEILAAYGEDLNHDGQVSVRIHQYNIDLAAPEMSADRNTIAEYTALEADLNMAQSSIFLTDAPEAFTTLFGDFGFIKTEKFGEEMYIGLRPFPDKSSEGKEKDALLFSNFQ